MTINGMRLGLVLMTSSMQVGLTLPKGEFSHDLEELLFEFGDVFQLPKGLPPARL